MDTWSESQAAFADAAEWFVWTAGRVGDRWEQRGLGEWDVRALVGHTCRAFVTVEEYLQRPPAGVEVATTADYYRATREIASTPAVVQRARDAGRALGDDPVAAVTALADRVTAQVAACDGSELLTSIVGGMRLADYLPSRTFELVVHTADLAAALDEPVEPPASASGQALRIASEVVVGDRKAGPLLLALTGRTGLPAGFSVL
jgi:hypothetical protein